MYCFESMSGNRARALFDVSVPASLALADIWVPLRSLQTHLTESNGCAGHGDRGEERGIFRLSPALNSLKVNQ